jgi:hypothetical protein
MIGAFQRRELLRVARQLSDELGMRFAEAVVGEKIEGVYRRLIATRGERLDVIEKSREFTLVPWHPVLERQVGKPVAGILR